MRWMVYCEARVLARMVHEWAWMIAQAGARRADRRLQAPPNEGPKPQSAQKTCEGRAGGKMAPDSLILG